MTQQGLILKLIERISRSNLYLFIFSRYLTSKFLTKFIFESEFEILKILNKNKYFRKSQKSLIDIGANDGISYKTIRNFLPTSKIVSFEPLFSNFKQLIKLKKKDKNFKIYNYGLSNKISNMRKLYVPFFKNYGLTPFAGIEKKGVLQRLKKSLFIKDLLNKISMKSTFIKTKKLDSYNFNPSFIKIDIEGHEYECILGSLKTIKKCKPIIMVEYNRKICNKIYKLLKKMNYLKFFYDKKSCLIKKHSEKNVFNIIFINKESVKYISK